MTDNPTHREGAVPLIGALDIQRKGNEKKGEAIAQHQLFPARDSRTETPGNDKDANEVGDRASATLRFANPAFSNRIESHGMETTNDPFPGRVRN